MYATKDLSLSVISSIFSYHEKISYQEETLPGVNPVLPYGIKRSNVEKKL